MSLFAICCLCAIERFRFASLLTLGHPSSCDICRSEIFLLRALLPHLSNQPPDSPYLGVYVGLVHFFSSIFHIVIGFKGL